MARKQVVFKVDDKQSIIINEMKMIEIKNFGEDIVALASGAVGITEISRIMELLIPQCTDITYDDFMEFAPSEVKGIRKTFEEVNSDFLQTLEDYGIMQHFKNIFQEMKVSAQVEVSQESGPQSEQSLTSNETKSGNGSNTSDQNILSFTRELANKKTAIKTIPKRSQG